MSELYSYDDNPSDKDYKSWKHEIKSAFLPSNGESFEWFWKLSRWVQQHK